MDHRLRSFLLSLCLACAVLALESAAVNQGASCADFVAPVSSAEDVIGSTAGFGNAELVKGPQWAQFTSLGLGVWRLVLFMFAVLKYSLRPVLYALHILHLVTRPLTLPIQLAYHIAIGIPLSFVARLSRTLYPAYLFLGSAAVLGLCLGLGIAVFSRLVGVLLSSTVGSGSRIETGPVLSPGTPSARWKGKQSAKPMQKRSPPGTRSIMSTQTSLQTPTIFEESEASSYDDEVGGYDTDSDHGTTPTKSSRDYVNYKSGTLDRGLKKRS